MHNALVWHDTRTHDIVDQLNSKHGKDSLRQICGLPISTYFSALKIRWLLENIQEVKDAVKDGRCVFGNVDTWVIWNLTGGIDGGVHITDFTNASRTMLMDLKSGGWSKEACEIFGIPMDILPAIRSSSEEYGVVKGSSAWSGLRITSDLGDQQSAMLGQLCVEPGLAKNTYGTGCFMLMNTGTEPIQSKHGLPPQPYSSWVQISRDTTRSKVP